MTEEPTGTGECPEADGDSSTKSFLGHLEDLRSTIVRSAIALVVGMVISIPFAPRIVDLLKSRLVLADQDPDTFLQVIELAAGFSVAMRVIFWTGVGISLPFILFFVSQFVFPGLTLRERRVVKRSLAAAAGLFVCGVLMGYFMTLPIAIKMMFRVSTWINAMPEFIELQDYIGFCMKLLIAFGCTFELPVVVFALGALGLINSRQLRDTRRHVIVGLLILAMFLTPSDPYTMVLMAAPLIALSEVCIWLVWARERRSRE